MKKVLIIATSRKTRGGITAVIKAHETGEQWKRFHCHWIQTHRDGPVWRKLLYLAIAWVDYVVRIPFYDIIHVHFSLRTTARRKVPFVKLAKLLGKKVIVHLHCGDQIDSRWNEDYEYLFANADKALFLSECLKTRVEHLSGLNSNYEVCYNPCPVVAQQEKVAKQNIILFSGTLNAGKGYQDLIRAFALIANRYPTWKLSLAGNGEIDEGKSLAAELGVSAQVKFLGWVTDDAKERAFREASVFCLPSYAEGFPMAVLDAWAYGLPVVTTPVGGIPDVAHDGDNILLFEPGDIETLSMQLERMITNQELRQHISEASTKFATEQFNINVINKQLSRIYEDLF